MAQGPRCTWTCLLLLALPSCLAFLPNFWSRILMLSWDSHTHQYMTEQALLNVTLDTLRMLEAEQRTGTLDERELGRGFWYAVGEVVKANAAMDFLSSTRSNPMYHFDSERVEEAMVLLREFWALILVSVQARDYQGARQSLGQLLHSLQDFYSHSNWVEMGQQSPYLHLLHPDQPAVPVASADTPTCAECHTYTCRNNALSKLTQGKCSHGGILDSSRHHDARGGINKDSTSPLFSPHHYLHADAARLATVATTAVLQDLRDTVGPHNFLRLLSVRQRPALVFVIDTTGSMFEEITAARLRTLSIIQSRAQDEHHGQPGTFVLVPFHDPAVGPVFETDDPELFMRHLEDLTALGGGDEPEMCLSAMLLALTHSPPLSEIFVFTDASPKDSHLYGAVEALTLEKQSKVSFLLTEDPSRAGRWRRGLEKKGETLSPDRFSLYSRLSSVSGGLAVFTNNHDIQKVSAIVQDNTATNMVTLLYAGSDPASTSAHSFQVDHGVKSVTLHLAGTLKSGILSSPAGETQSLLGGVGPLAELEIYQGLYRISLVAPIQPGQWHLSTKSEGPVTFHVIGDSIMDFLYYFAVVANGTHPGLARVEGAPVAGVPTFLVLAVTGLSPVSKASFSHVTLLGSGGESVLVVPLNSSSSSSSSTMELVGWIESVPREPFYVHLSGSNGQGHLIERVSGEMIHPTHVQIQVLSVPLLVSGHADTVLFDVENHGPARHFTLSAEDDRGFLSQREPQRLVVGERRSVRAEVQLKAPADTAAGVSVVLTLTVQAVDSADSNYAVVHLTVIPQDHDTAPPSCSPMRVETACPPLCTQGSWTVSLTIADRGQSGLAAIQLSEGQGTLTILRRHGTRERGHGKTVGKTTKDHGAHRHKDSRLRKGEPKLDVSGWVRGSSLDVTYTSTCCSPDAELHVWDRAGNMRHCHFSSSQQVTKLNTSTAGRNEITLLVILMSMVGPVLI